jgi:hypothetical protein
MGSNVLGEHAKVDDFGLEHPPVYVHFDADGKLREW